MKEPGRDMPWPVHDAIKEVMDTVNGLMMLGLLAQSHGWNDTGPRSHMVRLSSRGIATIHDVNAQTWS